MRAVAKARRAWPKGATPRSRSRAEAGRTPCPRGCGKEELPHIRDLGQRPRVQSGDGAVRAERSYATSEARGGGREELPRVRGQGRRPRGASPCPRPGWRPGGATPRPRPGAAAGRSFPVSEAGAAARRSYPSLRSGAASQNARRRRRSKGRESLRHVGGQGRRPRGATPRPRPGAEAARLNNNNFGYIALKYLFMSCT